MGLGAFPTTFLFARAELFQLFAARGDLQAVRFDGEAEPMADFVFEPLDFFALKFHDLFAVLADDVVVMGMFGVVGIVELVGLPKIHFADQAALG